MAERGGFVLNVACAVVLLMVSTATSQSTPPAYTARVNMHVTGEGATESIVGSYIARELRALGDVVITDQNPRYDLSIVVIKTTNQAQNPIGYAISSVGLDLWSESLVRSLVGYFGIPNEKLDMFMDFANNGTIKHHFLQVCATEDIQETCSELVAVFDSDVLERSRKLMSNLDNWKQ